MCAITVLTVAPELQTLLLVGQAHAVVAVGQAVLTGGAIQQVHVGGTVRRCPGAVLGQVTGPRWAPAHGPGLFQLPQRAHRWSISVMHSLLCFQDVSINCFQFVSTTGIYVMHQNVS